MITNYRKNQQTTSAIQQLMGSSTPEQKQAALMQLAVTQPAIAALLQRQQLTPGEEQSHRDKMFELGLKYPGLGDQTAQTSPPGVATANVATPVSTAGPAPVQAQPNFIPPHPRPANDAEIQANKDAFELFKEQSNIRLKDQLKLGTPEQQENRYRAQTDGLDAMIDTIDKIKAYDQKDAAGPLGTFGYTQLDMGTGPIAGRIPKVGQTGYDLQSLQRQLQSQARLTGFQGLRDASISGSSGFSRTAVVEFNAIGDKVATVDPLQGKDQYLDQLTKLRTWAQAAKDGLSAARGRAPGSTISGPTEQTVKETPEGDQGTQTGRKYAPYQRPPQPVIDALKQAINAHKGNPEEVTKIKESFERKFLGGDRGGADYFLYNGR
jgi:hypothetical protein